MEQLSAQDVRLILNCLEALQPICVLSNFPAQVLRSLCPLIGSDVSFLSSFESRCNILEATPTEFKNFAIDPDYFQQNPTIQRYAQTQDGNAYKISDFLSEQEVYRKEGLYDKHLHLAGLIDQFAMVIPDLSNDFTPTFGQLAIGFYRSTRSFNERDRTVLNLIRPHIAQAYRNAQSYTQLQQHLEHLHQAIDELGSIILSPTGQVHWISPRAIRLLNQYFSDWSGAQLPDTLESWMREQLQQSLSTQPLRIEQFGQTLEIRLLGDATAEQFLLILEENRTQQFSIASLQRIGLTPRESEVLFWIAQGKTDAEIAIILSICQKTVNKHSENLFRKLAAKSRAAAVTKALERLKLIETQSGSL